jgi:hypothetical protein
MLKDLDSKKKIELAITGIGVIILIVLIASHVSVKTGKVVSDVKVSSAAGVVNMTAPATGNWDDVKWGRDPFLLDASNVKEHGMEDLSLNGIVSDKDNPYAIINNEVIKPGDIVSGMKVIEINEKSVVLEQNNQKHTLELNAD